MKNPLKSLENIVRLNIAKTVVMGSTLALSYVLLASAPQPSASAQQSLVNPAQYAVKAGNSASGNVQPQAVSPSAPAGFTFLPFRKSVAFTVTSYFDEDPRNDIQRKYDGTPGFIDSRGFVTDLLDNHFGIDYFINMPKGTVVDVLAMQDGFALTDPDRRDYLQVGPGSNNVFIGYARLSRIAVANGQAVSKGQKIGEVIANPSAGKRLHVEAINFFLGNYFYWDFFRDMTGKSSIGGNPAYTTSLWPRDNCPQHFEDLGSSSACIGTIYIPGQNLPVKVYLPVIRGK